MKLGQSNNSTGTCRCSNERKAHQSLTLNEKADVIMLSEEGHAESRERLQAGPLALNSQGVNAKEKLLKQTKTTTSVNTQMIRQ